MNKGKVERVRYPEPPKTNYGICIDGNWYSTFDKEMGTSVKAGYLVEYAYETNDKGFNNLTELKVIEAGTGTPIAQTNKTYWKSSGFANKGGDKVLKRDPEEEKRITRMACLNSSVAYWKLAQGEDPKIIINTKNVLRVAEIFYNWVRVEDKDKPEPLEAYV
jgi:hypothetical protein